MWPFNPDGFVSLTEPPDSHNLDDAWYFIVNDGEIICVSENGSPRPVARDEFRWLDMEFAAEYYLGHFHGRACFAVRGEGRTPEGYAKLGLRAWLGKVEPALFYLAGRAQQVIEFDRTHVFCGVCGSETVDHAQDRAKQCPDCGLVSYPRLSPSIIVLIRRDEKMLLARNANWPANMYSTLAGFVEPGESIEQTVHREVEEEVGLKINNLKYFGSQSWPFPNSLMLGFHADYVSGDIVCQDGEIADAKWFGVNDLPNIPPKTAISGWLIDAFVQELES